MLCLSHLAKYERQPMTFEEWWKMITAHPQSDNRKWLAEMAWAAGKAEGFTMAMEKSDDL